jgi:hypothetical protein
MKNSFRPTVTAMLCAAAVTAQFVGGKATRDALALASLGLDALPTLLMLASAGSILLIAAQLRWGARISPPALLRASFAVSGLLLLAEWIASFRAPASTAFILYIHTSAAGPLLISGFWSIATERFDPTTAKRRFGQIAGAGTLGGLLGALVSERVGSTLGAPAMLPFLAIGQFLTVWLIALFAGSERPYGSKRVRSPHGADLSALRDMHPQKGRSDLRVVAEAPHLRTLAALILLGTTSAALLDYLFKTKAVEALGPGDQLLRFFALYYAAISLATFMLQVISSRAVLERFGVGLTTSTPSIALLAGSIGALLAPGFGGFLAARAGESIFRGSWFRAGYELFYTPISTDEKRAVKSVIDVGVERAGDALGGATVRVITGLVPAGQSVIILSLALAASAISVVIASRLNKWYVRTLASSLVDQAAGLSESQTEHDSTRHILLNISRHAALSENTQTADETQDIVALKLRHRERAIRVLSRPDGLNAALVAQTIPLLAFDPLADYALFALRKVAEERVGQLTDALVDPNQDYAVRRRLARVFSVGVSQRAADAMMMALDDVRFDVRFQAARSLAAIFERNPRIRIDQRTIFDVILREVAVGRPVWESRRLLDGFVNASPLDEFVRDRAGQSLAHVFTLLSLILPAKPLLIAFRSLHSQDMRLRGTALEYLEGVLPAEIRHRLWPYLEERPAARPAPPHDEIIANLLRSSSSVTLHGLAPLVSR